MSTRKERLKAALNGAVQRLSDLTPDQLRERIEKKKNGDVAVFLRDMGVVGTPESSYVIADEFLLEGIEAEAADLKTMVWAQGVIPRDPAWYNSFTLFGVRNAATQIIGASAGFRNVISCAFDPMVMEDPLPYASTPLTPGIKPEIPMVAGYVREKEKKEWPLA